MSRNANDRARGNRTDIRKLWLVRYPPDKDGYYKCWICRKRVHISQMTLDHVMTVEDWPEYAKELSNMKPSHGFCNENRAYDRLEQLRRRGILKRRK